MSETTSFLLYVLKIIVAALAAGSAYYIAQSALERNRFSMSFQEYLECVRKVSAYDWSKFPGGKPASASEICKNR
jgi:hypothetical protein